MAMNFNSRVRRLGAIVGCFAVLLASAAAQQRPRTVAPPQNVDAPTMTNDVYVPEPAPLPAGWPSEARDVHLRGSACEVGETPLEARSKGQSTDEVLATLGQASAVLPPLLLAVRRQAFLGRSDVLVATYSSGGRGAKYDVHLRLTEEGVEKVKQYTTEHHGECLAVVAGGKILTKSQIDKPLEGDTLIVAAGLTIREAAAIVELFGRN